jgi:hypothetical protein
MLQNQRAISQQVKAAIEAGVELVAAVAVVAATTARKPQ